MAPCPTADQRHRASFRPSMRVGVRWAVNGAKCLSCKGNWDLSRVQVLSREGASRVKRSKRLRRVKVSADGVGVVSHAGVGRLRELAEVTGLTAGVTAALADTYAGPWVHAPGRVFTDMAVAIADGADCVSHIEVFGDRGGICGPVASMPTTWRMLDGSTRRICQGCGRRGRRLGNGRGPRVLPRICLGCCR